MAVPVLGCLAFKVLPHIYGNSCWNKPIQMFWDFGIEAWHIIDNQYVRHAHKGPRIEADVMFTKIGFRSCRYKTLK